nr:hypothetical protein Itr_chr11CG10170 [Ipomoea trifida]
MISESESSEKSYTTLLAAALLTAPEPESTPPPRAESNLKRRDLSSLLARIFSLSCRRNNATVSLSSFSSTSTATDIDITARLSSLQPYQVDWNLNHFLHKINTLITRGSGLN